MMKLLPFPSSELTHSINIYWSENLLIRTVTIPNVVFLMTIPFIVIDSNVDIIVILLFDDIRDKLEIDMCVETIFIW